jgi:(1->4)-alpha-D-glucan 1-alpha-D-glucosylmutase
MHKAMREAKVYTSWINPSEEHEAAMQRFIEQILARDNAAFRQDFGEFTRRVSQYGIYNSLAQLAIKVTAPGVPDFYQGTELWDFSLVDPDNRRPVDYDLRAWWLGELVNPPGSRADLARALVDSKADGRIKLYLTHRALRFRRDHAELFRAGSYTPLETTGDAGEYIVAFARALAAPSPVPGARGESVSGEEALSIAPRLLAKRLNNADTLPLGAPAWGDALLALPHATPGQRYRDIFTDCTQIVIERDGVIGLPLAKLLEHFPVALLERTTRTTTTDA